MTEKRFTIENEIEMKDNWNINKRCYHFGNGFDAKDCCELLNELQEENEQLKQQVQKIHKLIDDNIQIYEDTTTNDDFLQIQLDTKLQTLYNLRKELFK